MRTYIRFGAPALMLLLGACSFVRDFDDFEVGALCTEPQADCDLEVEGCETTTTTDRNHCGGCDIVCDANSFCEASTCRRYAPGPPLFATIAGNAAIAPPTIAPAANNGVFATFRHSTDLTLGGTTIPTVNFEVTAVRFNAAGALNWALQVNGSDGQPEQAYDTASSADGVYIAGGFNSPSVTFASTTPVIPTTPTSANSGAAATEDGFLWALDEAGNYRWHVQVAGAGTTNARFVETDAAGNVYIAGQFSSTDLRFGIGNPSTIPGLTNHADGIVSGFFVSKFLSNGGRVWTKAISGPTDMVEDLAVDASGNVYLFGTSSGTVTNGLDTHTGNSTPRLFRLAAADGDIDYFRPYSSAEPSTEGRAALTFTSDGTLVVTFFVDSNQTALGTLPLTRGTILASIDPVTGDPLTVTQLGTFLRPNKLEVDASGMLVMNGTIPATATLDFGGGPLPISEARGIEAFVAGYTPEGVFQWVEVYGHEDTTLVPVRADVAGDLAPSRANRAIFLSGTFWGELTFGAATFPFVAPNSNAFLMRLESAPSPIP